MKFISYVGARLARACVYFTVTQFFITAMFQLTAKDGSRGQFLLFDVEIVLFAFSLVMAFAQDILFVKRLSFPVRLLLHFLVTMAALFVLFSIVTNDLSNATRMVFLLSGAAAVYAVGAAAALIVRAVRGGHKTDGKEYTPMFKK